MLNHWCIGLLSCPALDSRAVISLRARRCGSVFYTLHSWFRVLHLNDNSCLSGMLLQEEILNHGLGKQTVQLGRW